MIDELHLFRGCLIPTRLPFLEKSSRRVLDVLRVEVEDLPGATCCVEPIGLRSMAYDTWLVVAARMLSIAESAGRDILTLCNGCYLSLKEAHHLLLDEGRREEVNRTLGELGRHYGGGSEVIHLLDLVRRRAEEMRSSVVREMEIELAIHPGCHLARPSSVVDAESPFRPGNLAKVAGWTGAGIVNGQDWPSCCGGGLSGVDDGLSQRIFEETVRDFREAGAEAILTPCPFCFAQFDSKQKDLPVLYLSELLALSMGLDGQEIGLQHHRVKPQI